MRIIHWDPFQDGGDVLQRFNQLLGGSAGSTSQGEAAAWRPLADISESEQEYLIKAQLPEVDRKDIRIDVSEGVLSISGERKSESEQKDETVHRVETFYGRFSRSFRLPDDVDVESIRAEVKDGVLSVHLPKTAPSQPQRIQIRVE